MSRLRLKLGIKLKHLFMLLFAVTLTACVTTTPMNSELPSTAALGRVIVKEYGGDANAYLRSAKYINSKGTWWPAYVRFAHEGRVDLLDVLKARGWEPNGRFHPAYHHTRRYAMGHGNHTDYKGTGSVQAVKTLLAYGVDPDNLATDCENEYVCPSALTTVVIWGEPGMLQPILEASDQPA